MNMHATDNLKQYPLPPSIAMLLHTVDARAQQDARNGLAVAAAITLSDSDYAKVNAIVLAMSGHRFNASNVRWNGRPLRRCAVAAAA
jgi:hypothetical protein